MYGTGPPCQQSRWLAHKLTSTRVKPVVATYWISRTSRNCSIYMVLKIYNINMCLVCMMCVLCVSSHWASCMSPAIPRKLYRAHIECGFKICLCVFVLSAIDIVSTHKDKAHIRRYDVLRVWFCVGIRKQTSDWLCDSSAPLDWISLFANIRI